MARIKLAYIGGGSTRGAGTMASFIHQGADFDGSEVVLVDLDPERLALVRALAEQMAKAEGLDIAVTATTDRRAGLEDCDAVLSSFRPGGFAARALDERIPLQARRDRPGDAGARAGSSWRCGRSHVLQRAVLAEIEEVCPAPGSSTTRTP